MRRVACKSSLSRGDDIVDNGKLSKLQLEGVSYACQKHCELLPDGSRAGFMIGRGPWYIFVPRRHSVLVHITHRVFARL